MAKEVDAKLFGMGLVLPKTPPAVSSLHARFGIPPFSVWNTREGWWQQRRAKWLDLGIQSEVGRADELTYHIPVKEGYERNLGMTKIQTSVFDPVLCELVYRLFAPDAGVVIDPFAGGSVRGIIASVLGLRYWGMELRGEQVAANRGQATRDRCGAYKPKWTQGDSRLDFDQAPAADLLFSCPPYGNLEQYSDDPADLSRHEFGAFMPLYAEVIESAVQRLKNDRFACFVVGNYRHKKTGQMHDLVGRTVQAFEGAGAYLYNEIILVNCVGTGGMRTNTSFVRGKRKIIKLHQNVLVFCKGDWAVAAEACQKADEQFVDRG